MIDLLRRPKDYIVAIDPNRDTPIRNKPTKSRIILKTEERETQQVPHQLSTNLRPRSAVWVLYE